MFASKFIEGLNEKSVDNFLIDLRSIQLVPDKKNEKQIGHLINRFATFFSTPATFIDNIRKIEVRLVENAAKELSQKIEPADYEKLKTILENYHHLLLGFNIKKNNIDEFLNITQEWIDKKTDQQRNKLS